jgi:chorismate mutase-like protein
MTNFTISDLEDCRVRIDELDLRLLELLNERTKVVERIGAIKRSLTLPIYEPKREEQVLSNVLEHNQGPLSPEAVRRVFERIMDEMRTLQKTKMLEAQNTGQNPAAPGAAALNRG